MTPDTHPMRADARRNRERVLTAAARAFAQLGPDATLEGIAKDAGVGIGTLYRHFPTRDALVEAVYRNEVTRLCGAASDLLTQLPTDRALRVWMDRFVDYMTTKRGMGDALRALAASSGNPFAASRERMVEALSSLLDAGAAAGTLRGDVEPADVLASVSGIGLAAADPTQAARMLDLLMDGLRRP